MPNGGRLSITTVLETIHRAPTPMDPECRDGEYLCLTFHDTGTGMDTQVLSRIFEPFFTTKAVGKWRANRIKAPPFGSVFRRADKRRRKRNWWWTRPCAAVARPSS